MGDSWLVKEREMAERGLKKPVTGGTVGLAFISGDILSEKPEKESSGDEYWKEPSDTPTVPEPPTGVSLEENLKDAETKGLNPADIWWFYNQVRLKGPWDYKQDKSGDYENFGNFNYGATGKAMGIPDSVLRRMAGWASTQSQSSRKKRFGNWYSDFPYGDDPKDQYWIQRGIDFYNMRTPLRGRGAFYVAP